MTRNRRRLLVALAIVVLLPFVVLAMLLVAVRTPWAEKKASSIASAALHRDVRIQGIALHFGWPPRVTLERLQVSNPDWATERELVDASGLSARIAVPPLFVGRYVIPYLEARQASADLEVQGDRATWRFGPASNEPSRLVLGHVELADGRVRYLETVAKTDLTVLMNGSLGAGGQLALKASGRFRGEEAQASARVPHLDPQHEGPFDFSADGMLGATRVSAQGMARADGDQLDLRLKVAGNTMAHLGALVNVVLPETPPYSIAGHLIHQGTLWRFEDFSGKVGNSDLAGRLDYEHSGKRPMLRGDLHSKVLDLADLGPLVGAPPGTKPGKVASPEQRAHSAQREAESRLLPDASFEVARWGTMDADVKLESSRIVRPDALPIDSFSTHLTLQEAKLRLTPMTFGVAGGQVRSEVLIDGAARPVQGRIDTNLQGLQLNQLVPVSGAMRDALGVLYGRAQLTGAGQSVADLLGTSNGRMAVAVDGGRVSELLIKLLNLDIPDVLLLLGTRNKQVELRCAAGGVDVKDGVATPDSFIVDTTDSQVRVGGSLSLREETLALEVRPLPKDPSFFSLRTPIDLTGPMRHPKIHLHLGPIAARVAGAVALAAAAPPLAILPFLDRGPGKDTDCGKLLAEAHGEGAQKKQ